MPGPLELALDLVEVVHPVWEGFGHDTLTAEPRNAMMDALGVTLRVDPGLPRGRGYFLFPRLGADGYTLSVRPNLRPIQLRFVSGLASAERALGPKAHNLPPQIVWSACVSFALAGVITRPDLLAEGSGRVYEVCRALAGMDRSLPLRSLLGVAADAERLLRALPPLEREPEEVELHDSPGACAPLAVARRARKKGDSRRALVWYWRTIRAGRTSGEWGAVAAGYIGLGNIATARGKLARGRRYLLRARRVAVLHGCAEEAGMAAHDLMVLAAQRGRTRHVRRYTSAALKGYGPGHPMLLTLAGDVATFWSDKGCFRPALTVYRGLLSRAGLSPEARLSALGNAARAYGATGQAPAFRDHAHQVLAQPGWQQMENAAPALVALAEGAAFLGEELTARALASAAVQVAAVRGEPRWEEEARSLLALQPGYVPPAAEEGEEAEDFATAAEVVAALAAV